MGIRTVAIAAVVAAAAATAACTVPVRGTPAADTAVSSAAPSPSAARSPRAQGSTYRDEQGRFAIVPPPGWPLGVSGRGKIAAAFVDPELTVSSSGDQFRANVGVVIQPADGGLAGVVASTRLEYESFGGHRVIADEPLTLPDGSPAHLLAGIVPEPTNGVMLQYVEVIAVHGGAVAVLATGTALPDTWDRYGPVFQTSLRSLTVAT